MDLHGCLHRTNASSVTISPTLAKYDPGNENYPPSEVEHEEEIEASSNCVSQIALVIR